MFLIRDFCKEKLLTRTMTYKIHEFYRSLAREVTIFPEKKKKF